MIGFKKLCAGMLAGVFFASYGISEEKTKGLPKGDNGIAAKYPGDRGIENAPDVLFVESFESAASVSDLGKRWDNISNAAIMSFSEDIPPGSSGKSSLLMTHIGGKSDGGHLYRRLLPGYETLHFRFYTKIAPDCYPIHHFVHTGGYNPPTPWPQGGAGSRPKGDKHFSTAVEPHGDRWVWDYYTYWMEMRGSPPRGQTWGNSFIRDPNLKVKRTVDLKPSTWQRGKWTCLELMVKLNDVGDTNGEMGLWVDGKLVSHLGKGFPKGKWIYDKFIPGEGGEGLRWSDEKGGPENFRVPPGGQPFDGFRWRTVEELKNNWIWMLLYITKAPAGYESKVWFDDIVVAKKYIGPIVKKR